MGVASSYLSAAGGNGNKQCCATIKLIPDLQSIKLMAIRQICKKKSLLARYVKKFS